MSLMYIELARLRVEDARRNGLREAAITQALKEGSQRQSETKPKARLGAIVPKVGQVARALFGRVAEMWQRQVRQ